MKPQVAIVRRDDHDTLADAIHECLTLFHGIDKIKSANRILLKPNCLQDNSDAATDLEMIRNTIQVIQKIKDTLGNKYEIFIGDSPGLLAKRSRKIFENLGIMDIIQETGITYIEFDGGDPPLDIKIPDGVRLKETKIAPIIENVDLIVNLPRLKTHMLTVYTGCIKNFWGVQPGGLKARNHLKGTSTESFSQVITDLFSYLANKPQICLMGGDGMEGSRGPSSGPMRELNLIFGGSDPVAVDAVAIHVVGHDALEEVPHIRMCSESNLGVGAIDQIDVVGIPLSDAKLKKPFKFPGRTLARANSLFGPLIYRFTKKLPHLQQKKCIKCGNCAKICPGEAISLSPYPKFNRKKCINCLCCVETCPEDAIRVGTAGLMGILGLQ